MDDAKPKKIAIWDLDGTLLRRATFTPFLVHAARLRRPVRLALVPVWIAAMIGYKAGFWSREALKQFGLGLFLGKVTEAELARLAATFTDGVWPHGFGSDAKTALGRDRQEGRELVLATAAMGFYALEIGQKAGFDHVVATGHEIDANGRCRIVGGNCYGESKVRRLVDLLATLNLDRRDCHIRFYSDSISDAPLLDWADEAVLVNAGREDRRAAQARGWSVARFGC